MSILAGNIVRLTAKITEEGTPVDPDTVTVIVQAPGGTRTEPDASKAATGTWTADIECSSAGLWRARVEGAGNMTVAGETTWRVEPSNLT